MSIEGFIGRPGRGKTYEMTRRVLEEADRDRLCFTNYPVRHPNVYLFTPDQLLDLPRGLVAIDEAHLWFPARMSLKLPSSWLAGMSQTRKAGWDMLWSAQHESRVDRMIRDVTDYMWLCDTWFKHNGHPVMFSAKSYEPEDFRRKGKELTRYGHFFSKRVAQAYDTFGSVGGAEHTKDKNDVYEKARGKRGGSVLEGVL
jgi:zona occludens toxin (predicted ATPase)